MQLKQWLFHIEFLSSSYRRDTQLHVTSQYVVKDPSSLQMIQMNQEGKRRRPHGEEGQEDVICMVCGSA